MDDDRQFKLPDKGRMDAPYDESDILPEMLPVVRAIRNAGIETIASNSEVGHIGDSPFGSYIQIRLIYKGGPEIAKKIDAFAKTLTPELRKETGNPNLALQVVSAEKWYDDQDTTSIEIINLPIYRLQLTGHTNDEEIRYVWNTVAEKFNHSVIE